MAVSDTDAQSELKRLRHKYALLEQNYKNFLLDESDHKAKEVNDWEVKSDQRKILHPNQNDDRPYDRLLNDMEAK